MLTHTWRFNLPLNLCIRKTQRIFPLKHAQFYILTLNYQRWLIRLWYWWLILTTLIKLLYTYSKRRVIFEFRKLSLCVVLLLQTLHFKWSISLSLLMKHLVCMFWSSLLIGSFCRQKLWINLSARFTGRINSILFIVMRHHNWWICYILESNFCFVLCFKQEVCWVNHVQWNSCLHWWLNNCKFWIVTRNS